MEFREIFDRSGTTRRKRLAGNIAEFEERFGLVERCYGDGAILVFRPVAEWDSLNSPRQNASVQVIKDRRADVDD